MRLTKLIPFIAAMSLLPGALAGQGQETEPALGYIRIFADTDQLQIYLDGVMIGYTPILEKIPLQSGWHTVSFFPPEFEWAHWTHRQAGMMKEVIDEGTRHVLVEAGDLKEVHLAWQGLEQRIAHYESGRRIGAIVGISMIGITLLLLALAI